MDENIERQSSAQADYDSWVETLAGLGPSVFFGLWAIVNALPSSLAFDWLRFLWGGLLIVGYLGIVVGFTVGWVRGFPRWSYAYVVCVPLFSLYAGAIQITRHEFLGWRSLVPLGVAAVIALVLTRSLRPLIRLVTRVWEDWTRLSFAVYSLMPLLVWIAFDEVQNSYELPFMVALQLILVGGAMAYMRSAGTWRRALVLVDSVCLVWIVTAIGNAVYWRGRLESWMPEPADVSEMVSSYAGTMLILIAFLVAPALLALFRRPARVA